MKQAFIALDMNGSVGSIDPKIYGHFSEHIGGVFYDGLYVGEDSPVPNVRGFRRDLVESFRRIAPPVLRWPGGCFAETYDWRDGIGPKSERPVRVNWWYSRDHRTEPNLVGTHEFIDLCRQVGAEPYIAANMTSTWPLHIRDWVEYCNFPGGTALSDERARNGSGEPFGVRWWGIGNENWGGGGNMTPEMCAREFRRYSTVIGSVDKGNVNFIMCGADGHNTEWTERLMKEWAQTERYREEKTWGMSVHYYCGTAGDPQTFTEEEWYRLLTQADGMRRIVDEHRAAMDRYDPEKRIKLVIDEWGCWHREGTGPSKGYNLFEQQSSMRDACVAALTLNIFNNNCDVVGMACVAQLCNNLHSLYLAGGSHFVETPNYHVFDMYRVHQGARQIASAVHAGSRVTEKGTLTLLSASASEKDGYVNITAANLDETHETELVTETCGGSLSDEADMMLLTHEDPHAVNDFDEPERVKPVYGRVSGHSVLLPPASIVRLTYRKI